MLHKAQIMLFSKKSGCWKMRLPLMLEKSKIYLKYTCERLTKWVNSDEPNRTRTHEKPWCLQHFLNANEQKRKMHTSSPKRKAMGSNPVGDNKKNVEKLLAHPNKKTSKKDKPLDHKDLSFLFYYKSPFSYLGWRPQFRLRNQWR